ncbi:hypothetical protein HELRODRAFT_82191, partial [Helobdella robusta]|uniref:RFX-type winged-helix domain-containing protein n=1 Tax=Helobdella robusta TaxID=6412 RepID=T1G4P0_HELRO
VNWLLENYEATEGVSLPRSSLYNHYLRHCDQMKLEPMNQASFGKLIRSVFPQIRTRRLGTRGNSKYHYYGIKIKSTSSVHHIQQQHHQPQQLQQQQQQLQQRIMIDTVIEGAQMSREGINCQQQQFFTDTIVTLPNFGVILVEDGEEIPDGASQKHLGAYEELYAEQCEAIMAGIVNFQFSVIESLWKSFWRTDGQRLDELIGGRHDELERTLPCNALYALSKMPSVQKYTMKSDYTFYQSLIGTLIPDVLKPIPSTLTQVIRNFAKNLEGSLRRSMNGICTEMIECKVTAANAFSQTLRRYTSLNHLAQAARAVLQNSAQVTQMLSDLNRVDFSNIQEQAYWVCRCNGDLVKELETDLKLTLEKQSSLEEWVDWLEGVVNLVLTPHEHHVSTFTKVAHQFLLHWSFYSSMVIRDLTLRSAASFGSFHLIRLLFDEYMFFLVEKKVASIAGETTVATVGNKNLVRKMTMMSTMMIMMMLKMK